MADVALGPEAARGDQREQRRKLLGHRARADAKGEASGESPLEREGETARLLDADDRNGAANTHEAQGHVDGCVRADDFDHAIQALAVGVLLDPGRGFVGMQGDCAQAFGNNASFGHGVDGVDDMGAHDEGEIGRAHV